VPHLLAASALCLTALAAAAADAPPDPRASFTLFVAAVEHAPMVAATRLRLLAAHADHLASGAFSDPYVSVNPEHDPALTRSRFGITHTEVLLSQPLARWGEQDAQVVLAAALESEAEADLAQVRGEVAADLSRELSDQALAAIRVQLARQAVERANTTLAQVTAVLASAPTVRAQQLWLLQSRAEALDLQAGDAERDRQDAEARIRGLLGLPAASALPPQALPDPAQVATDAIPAVRIARARQLAARAEELQASSRRRPQVTVTAGWEGNHSDGAYEGMVSLTLPVHVGTYAAGEDAAHARAEAAEAEQRRAQFEGDRLIASVRRERAQASAAHQLATRTLERDNAELAAVTTVLDGAGTDALAVSSVIDALDRIAERRQSLAEADARAERAQAELWRLVPPVPGQAIVGATP
jgi:outer membrane protein TolC